MTTIILTLFFVGGIALLEYGSRKQPTRMYLLEQIKKKVDEDAMQSVLLMSDEDLKTYLKHI